MKFKIIRVSRRPPWPVWAVVLVVLWLCLSITTLLLAHYNDQPITLCLFKHITHISCPSCGLTRGSLHLLRGQVIQAWLCNPLCFTIGALCLAALFLRIFFARNLRICLTPVERNIAWFLLVLLFLANWLYVIYFL